eukprot:31440-Pelagococcus_subviridis.AAC.13
MNVRTSRFDVPLPHNGSSTSDKRDIAELRSTFKIHRCLTRPSVFAGSAHRKVEGRSLRQLNFAETLSSRLRYIDELETITGEVKGLLCKLRGRILSAVRSHIAATVLDSVREAKQSHIDSENATCRTHQEHGVQGSSFFNAAFYVNFCSAMASLKPILGELYAQAQSRRSTNWREAFAQICQAELELSEKSFPLTNDASLTTLLLEPLGQLLLDVVRPQYIMWTDMFTIAEFVDLIKCKVMEEQLDKYGKTGSLLQPFVAVLLADVRERLIFRAQTFLRDNVSNYCPSATDLDYPSKLELPPSSESSTPDVSTSFPPDYRSSGEKVIYCGVSEKSTEKCFHDGFPPLFHTLTCLTTLNRCLEARTFSGIAQEAVGFTDGQLFLIKHLLLLREQIATFEPDLTANAVYARNLNFSHLRGHVQRIIAGETSVGSREPGASDLLTLAVQGLPRLVETAVDSRIELEQLLKVACEDYIMFVTRQIVEPMLSFITKITAIRVSGIMTEEAPVRQTAFATPDRIRDIVVTVNKTLHSTLPKHIQKMRIYLAGSVSRETILNPIKSNISEAHAQFAAILYSEYEPELLNKIKLQSPSDLVKSMNDMPS